MITTHCNKSQHNVKLRRLVKLKIVNDEIIYKIPVTHYQQHKHRVHGILDSKHVCYAVVVVIQ